MKQPPEPAELLVGEVARRSGLSADLVRQFEQSRFIARAERDQQGRRLFPLIAVQQAILAHRLRNAGLGPGETRDILRLLESVAPPDDALDCHRRAACAVALRRRVALLQDVLKTLQAPNTSKERARRWDMLVENARDDAA